MRVSFKQANPLRLLFMTPRREEYLARYVVREHDRGRRLDDILSDPYVRNATKDELARLLERPEVVEALGEHGLAHLRLGLAQRAA